MSQPQTVFLVGATGRTGSSIIDALLDDTKFHVIAATRPASASKPAVEALKARGAEIRIVDLETESPEQLQEHLKGVDTVISAIDWTQFSFQKPLIRASKAAGVRRFIPCDWGSPCIPGIVWSFDLKATFQELIKEIGLGYTFIDVGMWYQAIVPVIDPTKEFLPGFAEITRTIFGSGDVKSSFTDLKDIGKFASRIISDERTLNKYVFCWAEQRTQNEVFALAERIVGRPIPVKETIPAENVLVIASEAPPKSGQRGYFQLMHSMFVRGDNTVENAKKKEYGGALDARELYPDFQPRSLESYATEYYSQ